MARIIRVHNGVKQQKQVRSKKFRMLSLILSQVYNMSRLYSSFAEDEKFARWIEHYVKLGFLTPGEANTLTLAKRMMDKLIEESIQNGEYKKPLVVIAQQAIRDVLDSFEVKKK